MLGPSIVATVVLAHLHPSHSCRAPYCCLAAQDGSIIHPFSYKTDLASTTSPKLDTFHSKALEHYHNNSEQMLRQCNGM